jgi:hypothetical protein
VVEGRNGVMVSDPDNNPVVVAAVQQIRDQFLSEFEQNSSLYIERDIEMIKSDYFIRRFLYPHDLDPSSAYEQFRTWMAWRKEMGFEDATDTRFPQEFYQIGALFPYMTDRDGTLLLYMRFKVYKKLDILVDPIKKFLTYHIDKLDQKGGKERSWAVIFDTRGAGIAQVDFDMLIFLIRTVKQYYPWGLKYVAVYELPWLLHGAWKVTQGLLPSEATRLFRFYNKNNISDLVDPESLPDFMGGTCSKDYRAVPEGCAPAEEVAEKELGMSADEVKVVKSHFEKHFQDINANCSKLS